MSSATTPSLSNQDNKDIIDEAKRLRRSLYLARIEGLASLADTAHNFINDVLENEPISSSSTVGAAIRSTPETVRHAIRSTRSAVSEIPRRVVDRFYEEYGSSHAKSPRRKSIRGSAKPKTKQKPE